MYYNTDSVDHENINDIEHPIYNRYPKQKYYFHYI